MCTEHTQFYKHEDGKQQKKLSGLLWFRDNCTPNTYGIAANRFAMLTVDSFHLKQNKEKPIL